jgi:hypothetical protein
MPQFAQRQKRVCVAQPPGHSSSRTAAAAQLLGGLFKKKRPEGRATNFASRRRFCAMAASVNSSWSQDGQHNQKLSTSQDTLEMSTQLPTLATADAGERSSDITGTLMNATWDMRSYVGSAASGTAARAPRAKKALATLCLSRNPPANTLAPHLVRLSKYISLGRQRSMSICLQHLLNSKMAMSG